MHNIRMKLFHCCALALPAIGVLMMSGCQTRSAPTVISPQDSIRIVLSILQHRAEADSVFRTEPESPFNKDTTVHFHGINWFPPNLKFFFRSKLYRYPTPEVVTVLGTKGEERK